MSWQVKCSVDGAVVAIVHGNYEIGDAPPEDAYELVNGKITYKYPGHEGQPCLLCTKSKHPPRTPLWKKVKGVKQ